MFAAWTELAQIRRWLGPEGVTIPDARLDLRPGGIFHYRMQLPNGAEMWGRWQYLEIDPPHRLVSMVAFSDENANEMRAPWEPNWPLRTRSEIGFREERGGTLVRIAWRPEQASEQERAIFTAGADGMRQGWDGTLDRLEAHLAAGS